MLKLGHQIVEPLSEIHGALTYTRPLDRGFQAAIGDRLISSHPGRHGNRKVCCVIRCDEALKISQALLGDFCFGLQTKQSVLGVFEFAFQTIDFFGSLSGSFLRMTEEIRIGS
ncbi:hypothetical protein BFJ63_vAg14899 [Fusarium oxysporum f. sp. narcissi]|uniref:Uncharacterized protein n=1 Tax=Fusarium oxysporum f. sp. narcissi TaxID=451672 RepID=A0A4Q2V563_FUSOX|nr:hypothetical protein BFJ63_vAg14899 [Fusarium oxysporum f. sp. narcissi]